MGNRNSRRRKEERRPLLEDYDGIQPVFNELKLVLIGSHGVGKNSIGNEIFKEKFFSSWIFRKNADIEKTHTVSGRRIQLTRTPGWKEYFNDPQKTKRKILQCVQTLYDTKPHAVLLALKVESDMPDSTVGTLEDLLSVQLWSHTIVVFTNGEKLRGSAIEDYIKFRNLKSLIDKCGKRYFVLKKNDKQIIETIEDFIVSKRSTGCFKPNGLIKKKDTLLSDLTDLVVRIRSKINSIRDFKQKLQSNPTQIESLLDSKDKEIKRLQEILKEKEEEIKRLRTQNTQRTIAELKETINLQNKELREKEEKIKELTKPNKMLQDLKTHEEDNAHVGYCCELTQDAKPVNSRRQTSIQLHERPSKGKYEKRPQIPTDSALHNWSETLLQILNELSDDDLNEMKYHMNWNDEYKINRSFIEEAERVQLADRMLKVWGKRHSVLKIRDLVKKIPRNDDVMINLFTPVLKEISETW